MLAIDWTKVKPELRAALEKRLPEGATLESIRVVPARIAKFEQDQEASVAVQTALEKAGGPKPITNGKPTIMRVVAWMAHEGINKNRLAFVKDDLEKAATKIKEPDFLPMDFNHSAVDGWGFEQKAIGVWYRAEMAQDPEADNAWGIVAYGMMWSWMNPDLADRLLAEQARNGRIDFSMACICGQITEARDDQGSPYEIAGDTTFFTLSALDVPPADPHATGFGVEGSEDPALEAELKQKLTASAVALAQLNTRVARAPEKKMELEALVAELKKLSEAAGTELKDGIVAALETKINELKADAAKLAGLETKVAELTTELESTKTKLVEAEAKVATIADKDVAIEAAKTEVATKVTEIERLTAELATVTTELSTFKAAEAEKAAKEKFAARYAELPASYREAFEKKTDEEQTKAKTRWAALDDDGWKAFVADISVAPVKVSYLQRSLNEKTIPAAAPADATNRLAKYKDR